MSYNDRTDVEAVLEVSPTGPATPSLVRVPGGLSLGGADVPQTQNAIPIGVPTPPAATPELVRVSPNGIAAGTESPRAAQIGVPATPTITGSTTPVSTGGPQLATTGPAQGTPAPRIAGAQMVPPTPPATQTATQLSQPAQAPQVLQGISTMRQG